MPSYTSLEDSVLNAQRLLLPEILKGLNQRSDRAGLFHLVGHLGMMGVSGTLWLTQMSENWAIALPALFIYGITLATMFAPLHECVHRTAFASDRLNAAVAWFAGLLSFYNSTFYRRYHKWHHRYTQIPGKDPELDDPKPQTWGEYLRELSGLPWWIGKLRGHFRAATGQLEDCPFLSDAARAEVVRSTRWQLAVYGGAIALSLISGFPWFLWGWIVPLAVGQPVLRFILLAEHGGCTEDNNPLTNTRTTLTLAPLRFLMWNMPFHAEHHLYPSIPFHTLPAAHQELRPYLAYLDQGYIRVNRQLVAGFGTTK
ncbi:fatty acid desaturase family protein [Vacuolonema iberomarrocanum]|uniref:fatty acid desaturase family protein n=1 Tax=Vacuolonema iberomarrocanum TaxID=3454632 RepID=UPI0019E53F18|nr:fatty acid desaturase family protein [filamentous cyanobacterium LEGE 07170]